MAHDPLRYPALATIIKRVRLQPYTDLVQAIVRVPMPCGSGVCDVCRVTTRYAEKRACVDGPVFDLLDFSHCRLSDHGIVELAPNHKYGLYRGPGRLSGAFGFGDAYGDLVDVLAIGRCRHQPRQPATASIRSGQRLAIHGDTFVVHTGWPNPGARRVIREHSATWERLTVPVIVHLLPVLPRSHRLPRSFRQSQMSVASNWVIQQGLAQAGIGVHRRDLVGG